MNWDDTEARPTVPESCIPVKSIAVNYWSTVNSRLELWTKQSGDNSLDCVLKCSCCQVDLRIYCLHARLSVCLFVCYKRFLKLSVVSGGGMSFVQNIWPQHEVESQNTVGVADDRIWWYVLALLTVYVLFKNWNTFDHWLSSRIMTTTDCGWILRASAVKLIVVIFWS